MYLLSKQKSRVEISMKKPPAPTSRVTLSFKVVPELKEALERAAAKDERSLSSLVQQLLSKAMRERKLMK
jgi:predicted HicB family RNase H-like nuclease